MPSKDNLVALVNLLRGRRIGGYRITEPVGHGGMGVVLKAEHEQLPQLAAVKVLYPEFSRISEYMARFQEEARVLVLVRHPGVARVFDTGQLSDDIAYIMMEYLDGTPLRHLMKQLPPERALGLIRQVAAAMEGAHAHGVVHRDLKPENVIVLPDAGAPDGEVVRIVDFGIALYEPARSGSGGVTVDEAGYLTTQGRFLGTVTYASPEQCRLEGGVDARSDVYSLGVMLYELLAGRPPFVGPPGVLMANHVLMPPPPLRQFAPDVPLELHVLVHTMLAKDREQRPSMTLVVLALDRIRRFGPVRLWWQRRQTRLAGLWHRHRPIGLAAALAAAVVGGTALGQRELRAPARPEPSGAADLAPPSPMDLAPPPPMDPAPAAPRDMAAPTPRWPVPAPSVEDPPRDARRPVRGVPPGRVPPPGTADTFDSKADLPTFA